jgi:hypothetical protein
VEGIKQTPGIVMEQCMRLVDVLSFGEKNGYTLKQYARWLCDGIVVGIMQIHAAGLVHADIKWGNICAKPTKNLHKQTNEAVTVRLVHGCHR